MRSTMATVRSELPPSLTTIRASLQRQSACRAAMTLSMWASSFRLGMTIRTSAPVVVSDRLIVEASPVCACHPDVTLSSGQDKPGTLYLCRAFQRLYHVMNCCRKSKIFSRCEHRVHPFLAIVVEDMYAEEPGTNLIQARQPLTYNS